MKRNRELDMNYVQWNLPQEANDIFSCNREEEAYVEVTVVYLWPAATMWEIWSFLISIYLSVFYLFLIKEMLRFSLVVT